MGLVPRAACYVCVCTSCVCVCVVTTPWCTQVYLRFYSTTCTTKVVPSAQYKSKKVKQLLECLYHYSWLPSSYCIRVMSFVNVLFYFKNLSETSGVSPIHPSSFVPHTYYTYSTCTHLPVYIYQCILFFVPCVPWVCSAHPTALLQLCSKCSCA